MPLWKRQRASQTLGRLANAEARLGHSSQLRSTRSPVMVLFNKDEEILTGGGDRPRPLASRKGAQQGDVLL